MLLSSSSQYRLKSRKAIESFNGASPILRFGSTCGFGFKRLWSLRKTSICSKIIQFESRKYIKAIRIQCARIGGICRNKKRLRILAYPIYYLYCTGTVAVSGDCGEFIAALSLWFWREHVLASAWPISTEPGCKPRSPQAAVRRRTQ